MSKLKVPTTSEEIEMGVAALVYAVQDPNCSNWFKPGKCWWLASCGDAAQEKYQDAVHFLDQIGVSAEDMQQHFGKKWMNRAASPFIFLETLGNILLVSVQLFDE